MKHSTQLARWIAGALVVAPFGSALAAQALFSPVPMVMKAPETDTAYQALAAQPSTHAMQLVTADTAQLDAPVVYASAREGVATADLSVPPTDLTPLFEAIVRHVPAPPSDDRGPFQMLISTIDHSPYLGRLGIGRIERGAVRVGDSVALLPIEVQGTVEGGVPGVESVERSRVTKLYVFEGLDRIEVEHDNLRAALAWSLEVPPAGDQSPDADLQSAIGLRLAAALCWFWNMRGYPAPANDACWKQLI